MKIATLALLLTLSTAASAQSLLDHIAYTSGNIHAECSDYLGKVSAAGNIVLRDFLIQDQRGIRGCALSALGSIHFVRGSVEKTGEYSCLSSARTTTDKVGHGGYSNLRPDFHSLNTELLNLGEELSRLPGARIVALETTRWDDSGIIRLHGSAQELLIVRSFDLNPRLTGLDVQLSGGLGPHNIVWDFPAAQTLTIARAGNWEFGMPGTFIAPQAVVTFNNALITGALYARSILGRSDNSPGCYGQVSGQINPAPLRLPKGTSKP